MARNRGPLRRMMPPGRSYDVFTRKLFGSGLIGHWPLNETAGKNCLTFNGTTTDVNCGSGASLDDLHDGEFTLDGWIYFGTSTGSDIFISKSNTATGIGWQFTVSATSVRFRVYDNTGLVPGPGYVEALNSTVATDVMHHVTGYFNDAGDRKAWLAIDGTWTASTALVDPIGSDAALNLVLGRHSSTAAQYFTGKMGWIRISNNDRLGHGVGFTPPSRGIIPTVDANTVALWPLNEGYGAVAGDIGVNNNDGTIIDGDWGTYPTVKDLSAEGNTGIYTGATLGRTIVPARIGGSAPFFDGVQDYVALYSAGLAADFSGAAGSMLIWARVLEAAQWTDGNQYTLFNFGADASNYIRCYIRTGADSYGFDANFGGTTEFLNSDPMSTSGWHLVTCTWDKTANQTKLYINDALHDTDDVTGTWAGSINTARLGDVSSNAYWKGWLARGMLLNRAVTLDEVIRIYRRAVVDLR